MTEEQQKILRQKINILSNASYSSGCADENEQQSYKQQDKWAAKTREATQDLFEFVMQCSSTQT